MDKVRTDRLRTVDTSQMADRPKLFVDTFGGWDNLEYMFWVERQGDLYRAARGIKGITDHNDFDAFLREQTAKEAGA